MITDYSSKNGYPEGQGFAPPPGPPPPGSAPPSYEQQQYPPPGLQQQQQQQQAYPSSGYGGSSSQWEAYPPGAGGANYYPGSGSQWQQSQQSQQSQQGYLYPGSSGNPGGSSPYAGSATSQWQATQASTPSPSSQREVYPPPPSPSSAGVRGILGQGFDKKRDPLNPPPPSFSRPPPPPRGPLAPFPPLTLYTKGETLDTGFPVALPSPPKNLYSAGPVSPYASPYANPYAQQQQTFVHPFFERDVLETDWRRLLEDVSILSQLSGGQKIAAQVIPLATGVGFLPGLFLTKGIQKRFRQKKDDPVANLVDTWNTYFFHPRRMHVILAHGPDNISGDVDGPAPDWIQSGHSGRRRRGSNASKSSSDSDDSRSRRRRGGGSSSGGLIGKLESRFDKLDQRLGGGSGRQDASKYAPRDAKEEAERYRLVVVPI